MEQYTLAGPTPIADETDKFYLAFPLSKVEDMIFSYGFFCEDLALDSSSVTFMPRFTSDRTLIFSFICVGRGTALPFLD